MGIEDLNEETKRISRVIDSFDEWSVKDQLTYVLMTIQYYEAITPIIDKYDTQKPFKFEIRRLDGEK